MSRWAFMLGLLVVLAGACAEGDKSGNDSGSSLTGDAGSDGPGSLDGGPTQRTAVWNDTEELIVAGVMGKFTMAFNNTTVAVRLPDDTPLVVWEKEGAAYLGRRGPKGDWSSSLLPSLGFDEISRPSLAQVDGQILLFGWTERLAPKTPVIPNPIQVAAIALSTDGGLTWPWKRQLSTTGQADGITLAPLDVGSKRGALIAWSEISAKKAYFVVWNGDDFGEEASWKPAASLETPSGAHDITVFARGSRAMASWESALDLPLSLWAAGWNQSLQRFDTPVEVSAGAEGNFGDPSGCFDGSGRLYLGYQVGVMGAPPQIMLAQAEPGQALGGLTPTSLGFGNFAHVVCDTEGAVGVGWEYFTTEAKDDINKTVGLTLSFDRNVTRQGPHAVPGSATARSRGYPAVVITGKRLDWYWQDIKEEGGGVKTLTLRHREAEIR